APPPPAAPAPRAPPPGGASPPPPRPCSPRRPRRRRTACHRARSAGPARRPPRARGCGAPPGRAARSWPPPQASCCVPPPRPPPRPPPPPPPPTARPPRTRSRGRPRAWPSPRRPPAGEPAAPLLEPAHHAVRGAQAVGGAAGEQYGVDVSHQVARVQRVDLARAGGAAAQGAGGTHAAHRCQHDGAPGPGPEIGPVAHGDALHGGEVRGDGFGHRCAKIAWRPRVVEGTTRCKVDEAGSDLISSHV